MNQIFVENVDNVDNYLDNRILRNLKNGEQINILEKQGNYMGDLCK